MKHRGIAIGGFLLGLFTVLTTLPQTWKIIQQSYKSGTKTNDNKPPKQRDSSGRRSSNSL